MQVNIFAHTEKTPPDGFPAYLSINRDEAGKHTITVRSSGGAGREVATIEMSPELLESLSITLMDYLHRDN